jgi:hypothetical protein
MKETGLLMLLAGLGAGLYSLTIETSVRVGNDTDGTERRTNNIGLISNKQNYLEFSGTVAIVGAILYGFGSMAPKKPEESGNNSEKKEIPPIS